MIAALPFFFSGTYNAELDMGRGTSCAERVPGAVIFKLKPNGGYSSVCVCVNSLLLGKRKADSGPTRGTAGQSARRAVTVQKRLES